MRASNKLPDAAIPLRPDLSDQFLLPIHRSPNYGGSDHDRRADYFRATDHEWSPDYVRPTDHFGTSDHIGRADDISRYYLRGADDIGIAHDHGSSDNRTATHSSPLADDDERDDRSSDHLSRSDDDGRGVHSHMLSRWCDERVELPAYRIHFGRQDLRRAERRGSPDGLGPGRRDLVVECWRGDV